MDFLRKISSKKIENLFHYKKRSYHYTCKTCVYIFSTCSKAKAVVWKVIKLLYMFQIMIFEP